MYYLWRQCDNDKCHRVSVVSTTARRNWNAHNSHQQTVNIVCCCCCYCHTHIYLSLNQPKLMKNKYLLTWRHSLTLRRARDTLSKTVKNKLCFKVNILWMLRTSDSFDSSMSSLFTWFDLTKRWWGRRNLIIRNILDCSQFKYLKCLNCSSSIYKLITPCIISYPPCPP